MIFKRRFSATLLVLLCGAFAATVSSDDLQFETDDLQVILSRPAWTNSRSDSEKTWQLISIYLCFPRSFTRTLQKQPLSRHHAIFTPKKLHNVQPARAKWCWHFCFNRFDGATWARGRRRKPLRSCHVSSQFRGWVLSARLYCQQDNLIDGWNNR